MPTEIKYEAPASPVTYLSTELNSLANDDTILGAKIDNGADGENEMFMSLELTLAAPGSTRTTGARVDVHLLASVDDTNFNYGDDAALIDPGTLLCSFPVDASTSARIATRTNLSIPPHDFKLQVLNATGTALQSSGNTIKYRLYSLESQ